MGRIQTGCRDCKKCTNSVFANLGRNSARAFIGIATVGMSEAGLAARKKCRVCGHQLSLHMGAQASTVQPGVSIQP